MTTAVNYESQRAEGEISQAMVRHDFSGPIVVMADGESHSECALAAAALLGARTGSPVDVLSIVIENRLSGSAAGAHSRDRRTEVTRQVSRVGGATADWPVHVIETTNAGQTAREFAESRGARLIVVARESHDDGVTRNVALDVVEYSDMPVYVATTSAIAVARNAIVGAGLGPSAVRVARIAASLIAQHGNITLLRVIDFDDGHARLGDMDNDLEIARSTLESTTSALRTFSRINCLPSIIFGDVAETLLAMARASPLTLVAVGTVEAGPGAAGTTRPHGRTLAAKLLSKAQCPILVVPTLSVAREARS